MPRSEFRCQECNLLFDESLSSSDGADNVVCKKCGSKNVRKTIAASSYKITGSGSSVPLGALSGCSSKSGFS
ncbi:MAG: zinc ribbon domain-containing protein [Desulfobulbaceae bacterium]|nr:zinc ribbon domain-containing protein [Desulfobulbaceae bacterium]